MRILSTFLLSLCLVLTTGYSAPPQGVPRDTGNSTSNRYILIDLWKRELFLYEGDRVVKQYPVAPGREQHPSPIGEWVITYKSTDWGGGFGTRWLGLNVPWGIYGIHGTNLPHTIGQDASHGCFRMFNEHVEELFSLVNTGTLVIVDGPLPRRDEWALKTLVRGDKGSDVLLVQNRLRASGYYEGPVDGIFGYGLEAAVKRWQRDMNWEVTAQISWREYLELGLVE